MSKRSQRRRYAILGVLAMAQEPLPAYVIASELYHLRSVSADLYLMVNIGEVERSKTPDPATGAPLYFYSLPGHGWGEA